MKTIRQLRQERDWTQFDLAERLGVSVASISNWERGLAVPRWNHLRAMVLLFGISVEDIALGPAEQASQELDQHGMG